MKATHVVAAIIKKNNHYLIAKRNRDKYMGLMWEFPGGKVEGSETLKRLCLGKFLKSSMYLSLFTTK